MSRRPKPSKLKLLEGTDRPDRDRGPEPEPPAGAIVRPAFLKYRAAEIWEEEAPKFVAMGTLTTADVHAFAAWCSLVAEFEESPVNMQASRIAQMRMLGAEFGMGAASRAKLGTGEKAKSDPADEFFGGKRAS